MDKQLTQLKDVYEKNIPTTFTDENQRKVMERIAHKAFKKNRRPHFFTPRLAAGISVILITLIIISFQGFDLNVYRKASIQDQTKELAIGAMVNLEEAPSNYHLYTAHYLSASIANHSVDTLTKEEKLISLKQLKQELDQINYKDKSREEFQEVIHLTKRALEGEYENTTLLKEIHQSLHELDNHFNKQRFIDDY